MNNFLLYIALLLFTVTACVSKKTAGNTEAQFSKADHAYIEAFHQGIRFKTKGRNEEAITKFEECLQLRQDDDAVYFALSKLELEKGNLAGSADYIEKAYALDPENIWYIQELAYMYFEKGDFPKSADNFEKLVSIEPRNIEWQYGYSEVLVKTGETEKAIKALNKTEDQIGINPRLSIQKYDLFIALKEPKKALLELTKARENFPKDAQLIATLVDYYFTTNQAEKGVEMLEALVVADPENGRAHLALADIYLNQKEKNKAYKQLSLAFESPDTDLNTKMKVLIKIHESAYQIDKEIYDLVNSLVSDYPNEAKVHSIHGDYLLQDQKEKKAIVAYKKALELDESQFPIWNQVLILEYQIKDYASLYSDSKECLSLFPSVAVVYLLHGVSSNQLQKYEDAIDVLSAGNELILNDTLLTAEFNGQLGEAYFGIKDFEIGKTKYYKALEYDPNSNLIKNNFAFRLAKSKIDLDLAESLAQKVLTTEPNQSQFIDTYGFVLFQKGLYNDALKFFIKANSINSSDKIILEHLGDAYSKLNEKEVALDWWKKAAAFDKPSEILLKKIKTNSYYEE